MMQCYQCCDVMAATNDTIETSVLTPPTEEHMPYTTVTLPGEAQDPPSCPSTDLDFVPIRSDPYPDFDKTIAQDSKSTLATNSTEKQATENEEESPASTNGTMTDMEMQDTLVAVVGMGDQVWALADRRLHERGRLLVLLTDRRPVGRYVGTGTFVWWPPQRKKPAGEQARQMVQKYGAKDSRRWIRKGPDIVELEEDEEYEVDEEGHGLRVLSHGQVVWEVSAKTVIANEVTDIDEESLSVSPESGALVASVPSARGCFGSMFLNMLFWSIGFCFNDFEASDSLPYWRAGYSFPPALLFGLSSTNFWSAAAVGIDNNSTKGRVQGALICGFGISLYTILLVIDSTQLNNFSGVIVFMSVVYFPIQCPLHFYNVAQPGFLLKPGEIEPERMRIFGFDIAKPRYWKWALATCSVTFGGWIVFYVVGVAYVLVVASGNGTLANIMLPFACAAVETADVWVLQICYSRFVLTAHATGNTWYMMSVGACICHGYAETIKVASMVSAAAFCAQHPEGLTWPEEGSCDPYGWIVSVGMGLGLTILSRYGWTRFLVGKVFRAVGLKKVAEATSPAVASKLHDEAKYYFGYTRFIVPLSLMISNIVTGKDPYLFNVPASWCCLVSFVLELLEDIVVWSEVIPYPPSPNPIMYTQTHRYGSSQLYAFSDSPLQDLHSRKSGRTSVSGKMLQSSRAHNAPAGLRTEGDHFPRALPLHGVRDMTLFEHIAPVLVCVFFAAIIYQLILGAGYFFGVCPLPMTTGDRFKEIFTWPLPVSSGCRYSD